MIDPVPIKIDGSHPIRRNGAGRGRALVMLSLSILALCAAGCGLLRVPNSKPKSQVKSFQKMTNEISGPEDLDTLQAQVMRFADLYATTVAQASDDFATRVGTPEARLAGLKWKLGQATAAFIDATGENPILNALDMLVLVTLSRMVVEDTEVKTFGDGAIPLLDTHKRLEADAWRLSGAVLKPAQQQELRGLIVEWRRKNPDQRYIGAIRFREFAAALGRTPRPETTSSTSIFSLLFYDPLSSLDSTTAAVEETRLLGERAMYYSQRMPTLLSWQTEVLAYQLSSQPESKQILEDASKLAAAAQVFAGAADQLPAVIDQQRKAAIQQVMDGFASNTVAVSQLAGDTRQVLAAGNQFAVSANAAVKSLDEFVRFVTAPDTNSTASATNSRPFDVLEYGQAATQVGSAARDLQTLLTSVNSTAPELTRISHEATARADLFIRHATLAGLLLIAVLLVGSVVAALIYRSIVRKWLSEPRAAPVPSGRDSTQTPVRLMVL